LGACVDFLSPRIHRATGSASAATGGGQAVLAVCLDFVSISAGVGMALKSRVSPGINIVSVRGLKLGSAGRRIIEIAQARHFIPALHVSLLIIRSRVLAAFVTSLLGGRHAILSSGCCGTISFSLDLLMSNGPGPTIGICARRKRLFNLMPVLDSRLVLQGVRSQQQVGIAVGQGDVPQPVDIRQTVRQKQIRLHSGVVVPVLKSLGSGGTIVGTRRAIELMTTVLMSCLGRYTSSPRRVQSAPAR
jgi:hypothetical protein